MICLGDEIFSFLLVNDDYMYFSFLVNGFQDIRTLKYRASLPSLLDTKPAFALTSKAYVSLILISSPIFVFASFL